VAAGVFWLWQGQDSVRVGMVTGMIGRDRTVTVTFEGVDLDGEGFTFQRALDATKGGDNPRFYGEQAVDAVLRAAESLRVSVEAHYGVSPARAAGGVVDDAAVAPGEGTGT
jgi:hypothetical protein